LGANFNYNTYNKSEFFFYYSLFDGTMCSFDVVCLGSACPA
jgi:hypothetical protein